MKKTTMKASLLALALGASSMASAAFNYTYVEGGFGEIDEGEVLFVNGAVDLNKHFGLVGGLFMGDADPDIDVTGLEIGAQYHQPLKGNLDLRAGLKILRIEAESNNYNPGIGYAYGTEADDTGFIANVGLRFQVQPKLQLEGDLKLSSNDLIDDGFGLEGAVRYYLNPKFSVAGGLAIDTELDGLFASLRYDM